MVVSARFTVYDAEEYTDFVIPDAPGRRVSTFLSQKGSSAYYAAAR